MSKIPTEHSDLKLSLPAISILRRMDADCNYLANHLGWMHWGTYKRHSMFKHPYTPQGLALMSGRHLRALITSHFVFYYTGKGYMLTSAGERQQQRLGKQTLLEDTHCKFTWK